MLFNKSQEELKKRNAIFTATEIYQQPETWLKTVKQLSEIKEEVQSFVHQVLKNKEYDVILTGAGTSEFVGNALYSYLNRVLDYNVKSYATTDLIATPENFIHKDKPTLIISFGRSGNSPESIGALDAVDAVHSNIYHLFITCNHEGALSQRAHTSEKAFAINLTPETHDQSFAMTSSFTNMYLACLLVFDYENVEKSIQSIATNTNQLLQNDFTLYNQLVDTYDFNRIVYLGSDVLKGIAQESALKMLELSAGEVVTMYDTPLGFRHGPKSIVNNQTLTVIYISDNVYTRQYEIDLLKEMASQRKENKILVVTSYNDESLKAYADYYYSFHNSNKIDNVLFGLQAIVVAQLIALFKSLSLNITPDNPCPSGEVNRVVKGVICYPYRKGERE